MIIKSIKFKNFYSFKDWAEMDFEVNDNAPNTSHFLKCDNKRFSKISVIYGGNASGKTNALWVFEFISWFISYSFPNEDKGFKRIEPFQSTNKNPSSFEVEFYIEDIFYKFSLDVDTSKGRVLKEILEVREDKKIKTLYSRKYDQKSKSYEFKSKNLDIESKFIDRVRDNCSVISIAKQFNYKKLDNIFNAWDDFSKNFKRRFFDELSEENLNSEYYYKNKNTFNKVKKLISKVDMGLLDIAIKKIEHKDIERTIIESYISYGVHKNKNALFKLPFRLESSGTKNMYTLLRYVMASFENAIPFCIDEIENSLHHDMIKFIIHLFSSSEYNKNNAQLICTSHSYPLMDELSKYQIFLTEKNKDCESEIYRLDEVEGVRSEDNLPKKYLAGIYGGVPDIDY